MKFRHAPIVLFVFARPAHTRRTLETLAANKLANQSDLIIYSDAARNKAEAEHVGAVRSLIHATEGFRSVTVIERKLNYGLARNIVEGVTEVSDRYGRVIVLEDDIVTSPHFLSFMNAALNKYADKPHVWHISGWNYPIDPAGLGEAFLWRVMNCWGWATWAGRWQYFSKDPRHLVDTWSKNKIRQFNLDDSFNFWNQVIANYQGKRNTWAIFWYSTIFENHGMCLNPSRSLVQNIGNDGTGENCSSCDPYSRETFPEEITQFPSYSEESMLAVQQVSAYLRNTQGTFLRRLAKRIRQLGFGNREIPQ